MSAPRIKRPFAGAASDPSQRQITSFFGRSDAGSSFSHGRASELEGAASAIPAHVQANLLSVGMRVRKSVPEGYKTGSGLGSFQLWSDKANTDTLFDNGAVGGRAQAVTRQAPMMQKELLPFCGLNKVGGMATQPESAQGPLFAPSDFEAPSMDDVPSLTSSQVSAASNGSYVGKVAHASQSPAQQIEHPTSRKRIFHTDEDYGIDIPISYRSSLENSIFDGRDWLDGQVSPRSLTPAGWGTGNAQRPIAMPRRRSSRRKGIASVLQEADFGSGELDFEFEGILQRPEEQAAELAEMGQENVMVVDDFEEAHFLDFRGVLGRDPGRDMAMDG